MGQGFTKGIPLDTDGTLSSNSDQLVPSQKAVKTYVDSNSSISAYTDATGGNYTLTSGDEVVEWKSGSNTAFLPTAVGIEGKRYRITNSGSGIITVDPSGSQTVFGDTIFYLYQGETIDIVSNNINWI